MTSLSTLFLVHLTITLTQSSFDCSTYPRSCINSPCSADEVQNCQVYNPGTGCSQCESTYFAKDFNHQCEQCQTVFGDACLHCQIEGCAQCTTNYDRTFDSNCGLYYCKPQSSQPPNMANNGDYAYLFTDEEYILISGGSKRIRRNIYDLTRDEWNDIATAMQIMKNIGETEGQSIYGSRFRNYDSLTCQHARGTLHRLGDLGHEGPHFLTWHRAFLLAFEESLIAINPNIEGLPYWNYLDDVNEYGYDLSESLMFSDDYFGSFIGDPKLNYQVTNGKFAFWKVNTDPSSVGCPSPYQNSFGMLRMRNNHLDAPSFTRNGGSFCNEPYTYYEEDPLITYFECLNLTDADTTIVEFNDCLYFDVHVTSHNAISGTFEKFMDQNIDSASFCLDLMFKNIKIDRATFWILTSDCIECPTAGSCTVGVDDPLECAACRLNTETNGTCTILGQEYTLDSWDETTNHFFGDFGDLATSPNDPMFWFHHANMDRYFQEWQLKHYETSDPYYGYPTEGWAQGINLNDILADEFPFENLFRAELGLGNGPYTNKDILDGTQFLNSDYTYDTVVELIKRDV